MPYKVVYFDEVKQDIKEAKDWYRASPTLIYFLTQFIFTSMNIPARLL